MLGAVLAGPLASTAEAAPKPKPTDRPGGKPGSSPLPTIAPTPAPTTAAPRPATTTAAPRPATTTAAPRPATTSAPRTVSRPRRLGPPTAPSTTAPARPSTTPSPAAAVPEDDSTARRTFESVSETLAVAGRDPELPLGVLAVVAAFLLLQNRIDRRDPKLAGAGGDREVDPDLAFRPPVRMPSAPQPRRQLPRPLLRIVVPDAHHSSPSALPGDAL